MVRIRHLIEKIEQDMNDLNLIQTKLDDFSKETLKVTLRINFPDKGKKYPFKETDYTLDTDNLEELTESQDRAIEIWINRYGKYPRFTKGGKKINKNEYAKEFDNATRDLGIDLRPKKGESKQQYRERVRPLKDKIKKELERRGYVMEWAPRWSERATQEVKKKLSIEPKTKEDQDRIKQFREDKLILEVSKYTPKQLKEFRKYVKKKDTAAQKAIDVKLNIMRLDKRIRSNRVKVLNYVLDKRGIKRKRTHWFVTHKWLGLPVVSVFERGRKGLVAREIIE